MPPTCGYVRGTRQVYGRSISRLPAALPIQARLRIVSIAEATSGPAFRTAGSALTGGADDLLRIGLDLQGSVFAPCLLGCPGTTRYQPSADAIPPRELRLSRQDASANMLVDCENRTPEQRTLNPRVRGSSPWRRTREVFTFQWGLFSRLSLTFWCATCAGRGAAVSCALRVRLMAFGVCGVVLGRAGAVCWLWRCWCWRGSSWAGPGVRAVRWRGWRGACGGVCGFSGGARRRRGGRCLAAGRSRRPGCAGCGR